MTRNSSRFADGMGVLGAPLSLAFTCAALLRRRAYDRGLLPSTRVRAPVLAVGGLEAGGSGKTPVAGFVLQELLRAGRCPGLVTRGYGRPTRELRLRHRGEPADVSQIGDEACALVGSGLDVAVAACPARVTGAQALIDSGCDALVMDDGFSHRALARVLDIVVLRAERPFGSGHMLPWGTLREPPSSLSRAGVVWLHHREATSVQDAAIPPSWWQQACPSATRVVSFAGPGPVREVAGGQVDVASRQVLAVAGIARPHDLQRSLEQRGAQVCGLVSFPDHHAYSAKDVQHICAMLRRQGAELVVTTAKDAVKLAPLWHGADLGAQLVVASVEVRILFGADELSRRLQSALHT